MAILAWSHRARPGSSRKLFSVPRNSEAVAPSTPRWSQESVISIRGRTTGMPASATTRSWIAADGEDRHLRRVEHGEEPIDAVHAEVRDREGAALEVRRLELACARPLDELDASGGQLGDRLELAARDDRDDEAVRHRNGEADVRGPEAEHPVALVVGVQVRVAQERDRAELREDVRVRRLRRSLRASARRASRAAPSHGACRPTSRSRSEAPARPR